MKQKQKNLVALAAFIVGLALFGVVWVRTSTSEDAETRAKKKVFYNQSVRNLKGEFEERNEEAIVRFESRIREAFAKWRGVTPEFVEDLTDFGSKTKLAGRTIGDLVDKVRRKEVEEKQVEEYVRVKFEHHFFTEDDLNEAVREICFDFATDLEANRNRFYAELRADWDAIGFTDREFPADEIMAESLEAMRDRFQKLGNEVVPNSVAAFAAGELVAWAGYHLTTQLATQIIARFGVTAATTAAAGGGATAVGAGGGTAVGSGGGPAVAVIGGVVGLAGGLLVDWWMTERMQEKITIGINSYLTDMESALINGVDGKPGVVGFYRKVAQKVVDEDVKSVRKYK